MDEPLRRWKMDQRLLWNRTFRKAQARPLEAAVVLKDLAALPGNRFEMLSGDRKGQYSIRINDQWRICFEWPAKAKGPVNVEIIDYH